MTSPRVDTARKRRHPHPVTRTSVPEIEGLPTLEGRAISFGFSLDAQQVLGVAHAQLSAATARPYLFREIDPGLADRLTTDDVVVAEEITGTIEGVDAAVAALAMTGVAAFVARRFPPAFQRAAHTHGIPILVVDTPSFIHTDDRVRLDLDAAKIVNLSSGDRAVIRNLDDDERAWLRAMFGRRLRV